MFVDLFNTTGTNDVRYGYVGEKNQGGWFFEMPAGLWQQAGYVGGATTEAEVDRVADTLDADEVDPPDDDLDKDQAIEAVRDRLAKYVRDEYGEDE